MLMMTIGYIYGNKKFTSEDRLFLRLARAQNLSVVTFPSLRFMSPEQIFKKAGRCDVILNASADLVAVEIAKIAEYAGVPVVDQTRSFYYCEDKLLFSLICEKNNIPTPKTFLLPLSLHKCRTPIKKLVHEHGAVVIKNIFADNGEFVARAKTVTQALALIKKFRKKDLAPLIAQEYVHASRNVYRVMVLNNRVVQGIVKKSKHWKCTGDYVRGDAPVFHVPPSLAALCVKIAQVTDIPWCGIDLMKKGDAWLALEANSCPAMDFVEHDMKRLYQQLLVYMVLVARGHPRALRAEQSSHDGHPRTNRAEQSSYDGHPRAVRRAYESAVTEQLPLLVSEQA